MKKMIGLCILGGFMAANATAQINKGTILLGGQIGGGSEKKAFSGAPSNEDIKGHSANFGISVGTAIRENKVIGIYGGYGSGKYNFEPQ